MSLADQDARDTIRTVLDQTLVVEAAAGTGKTTALVSRIIALLTTGTTRLSRIAAVTFTEKASGEMKLRLRAAIEDARNTADEDVRERLDTALTELEAAQIGTIHGFCAELLRERPIEAGLDPLFATLDEVAAEALFDEAFDVWWTHALAEMSDTLRRFIRRASHGQLTARETLRRAGWERCGWRDHRTALRQPTIDRSQLLDDAVRSLRRFADFANRPRKRGDRAITHLLVVRDWLDDLDQREAVQDRDEDALEASLHALSHEWGWTHKPWVDHQGSFTAKELVAARDSAHDVLLGCVQACNADLASRLHAELWPLVDDYAWRLQHEGAVDYFDLLAQTSAVLRANRDVRHDLQQRFTHLLVDEFQDTDPLQADILLLLAADSAEEPDPSKVSTVPGKLFIVGDPKQSIYRFRRADVGLYLAIRERLETEGATVLQLSTSFRSDPRIQAAINRAFDGRMTGGTQATYVPLDPFRAAIPSRPAVIALSLPEPYSQWGRVTGKAVRETEPAAVAKFIEWAVGESGWTVSDPNTGQPTPLRPRHICLLFRRLQSYHGSVAQPYSAALQAVGHPTLLLGGRSLHEREEVQALRTALTAIERPDDALAVYATLRGPLFAVGDDALLWFKHTIGTLHPCQPLPKRDEALFTEVAAALTVLAELHSQRNLIPISETVRRLLDHTRAHAGLALWAGGSQVLANALAVVEQARSAERGGLRSFRQFVSRLDRHAETRSTSEAAVDDDADDSVRIMTVHKAKGLEFPVVILCDSAYAGVPRSPGRWVDAESQTCASRIVGLDPWELTDHRDSLLQAEREESDRLLYVAATRARDILVVPAVADGPLDGWTDALHSALYPAADAWRDGQPSPGCPPFTSDATVIRPVDRAPPPDSGVRPGRYTDGPLDVTWWDGHLLGPPPSSALGFRRVDAQLLAPDRDLRHAAVAERHTHWAEQRAARIARGSSESQVVRTPSHAADLTTGVHAIEWHAVQRTQHERPHGKVFGTYVHAVLATVSLTASHAELRAVAEQQARIHGVSNTESNAAITLVEHALTHDIFDRARAAQRIERELPIAHRREDGVFIEGSADLVFWEGTGVVVVDYKTDLDVGERKQAYEVQLALYADALHAATGKTVLAIGLSV